MPWLGPNSFDLAPPESGRPLSPRPSSRRGRSPEVHAQVEVCTECGQPHPIPGAVPAAAPAAVPEIQIAFVLGDGQVIAYRAQLGEVLHLRAPEQLLRELQERHWVGVEVTRR